MPKDTPHARETANQIKEVSYQLRLGIPRKRSFALFVRPCIPQTSQQQDLGTTLTTFIDDMIVINKQKNLSKFTNLKK